MFFNFISCCNSYIKAGFVDRWSTTFTFISQLMGMQKLDYLQYLDLINL